MKKAFTMVEIIFVIVLIGILAGIAAPKIFIGREDAYRVKLQETVALIRSGIENYKLSQAFDKKSPKAPKGLCINATQETDHCFNNFREKDRFFAAVLKKPVKFGNKSGDWNGWTQTHSKGIETFIYYINNNKKGYVFQYNSNKGSFKCIDNYKGSLPCKDINEIGYSDES